MPVQNQFFDDVALPIYNPQQDHSPAPKREALIDVIGGSFDARGSNDALPQPQTIPVTGVVWGEDTYMVDGEGDDGPFDPDSEYWLIGDEVTMLRSQLQALKDKEGKQGTLWRTRLDGSEVREWKTVRFQRMSEPQVQADLTFKAHVTCEFRAGSDMANWHSEDAVSYSVNSVGSTPAELTVENPGATVYDAILTITCTSGTITNLVVECAELGIDWQRVTTSVAAGQTLVIDAGQRTMLRDGVNHYSFVYNGHTALGWFPIQEGIYTFTFTLGTGNASITLTMYPQFP